MKKIFIFSLLLCFQHNPANAMKRHRTDEIDSWLSSTERLPKKQSIEQKIIPAQKCPRPEYLLLQLSLESAAKKSAVQVDADLIQPNAIKAMKSPRAEFAQLATVKKVVHKPITTQEKIKAKKKYTCLQCDTRFASIGNLNRHQKTVHSGLKYSCDRCDKSFTQKYNLTVHQRTVHLGERLHECDQCSSKFKRKGHLTSHQSTVHSNERMYACNQCDKTYKTQGGLDVH
jgi:KRAB domain-containing zinc finger protein